VSARFGTPVRAILVSTAFCAALAVFTVPQLIGVYAWTRMATSIQTVLSFWQLRRKYPDAARSFRVAGGAAGAMLIVLAPTLLFAWAMKYSDAPTRKWGLVNLASGPIAYLWILYRRRHGVATQSEVVVSK
jgi:amino acid transporter